MHALDGHIRVLPIHVANKIAAGEVVERPASVAKELIENSIDAGARNIRIAIASGGKKLVGVYDDGSGMTRDDALLSLERQATSKILDVDDIENISTLGFRGEAIPSIASVSRFTLTTRKRDVDEGFSIQVNAGSLDATGSAGCPPGTSVEVRDLFCNVPARRKFLKSDTTEESHIKHIFTVAALANPSIGFSLTVDGRETSRLAPSENTADRIRELFGRDFFESLIPVESPSPVKGVRVSGFIERPNQSVPTRREQYVFVNGRAASAPSVAYALREAYPRKQGDVKPAAIIFITLPPSQVDVNVHPMKREVRFRDNIAVKAAIAGAIEAAFAIPVATGTPQFQTDAPEIFPKFPSEAPAENETRTPLFTDAPAKEPVSDTRNVASPSTAPSFFNRQSASLSENEARPIQVEFATDPESTSSSPWKWFNFLAITESGYLLIETDSGIVTVWPRAAYERIAYEKILTASASSGETLSQALLIPETVKLPLADFARLKGALDAVRAAGFQLEEFGSDTFKVEGVPQILGDAAPSLILLTLARDLSDAGTKRASVRWKEELVAKSIARTFAGSRLRLTEESAVKLVEDLASCRMPYVCPRGRPTMIFTSERELSRRFGRD